MNKVLPPPAHQPLEVHGLRSLDDLSLLTSSEAEALFVVLADGSVVQPFAPARPAPHQQRPATRPIGPLRKASTTIGPPARAASGQRR